MFIIGKACECVLGLQKTQAQSLLKYWGMTWSLQANIIALVTLSVVTIVVGYFMAVALKMQRQMRR